MSPSLLRENARKAAGLLRCEEFVEVVSHNDADGLSTAGIVCDLLSRWETRYHFRCVDDPGRVGSHVSKDVTTVACDLGASYLDRLPPNTVVVDHHPSEGRGGFGGILVTPRDEGDADDEASSSCGAHIVAKESGSGAKTADTALLGVIGDDVLDSGSDLVEEVIDDGVESGVIDETVGARLVGERVDEALAYSTDPYTEYTGDVEAARGYVEELGLPISVTDMDDDETTRFSTAVFLLALREASNPETAAETVGERYLLSDADGYDAHTFAAYVEACGKTGNPGLGLSLCLGDATGDVKKARKLYRSFESSLIDEVENADVEEEDGSGLCTVRISGGFDTGSVADVFHRWISDSEVVLVVNPDGEMSLRSGSEVDAGRTLRDCASRVGGEGGGHPERGGSVVPSETKDEFIDCVKEAVE
ncbi:DHH family phosphoesterase [Halorutilales archaeon Cl-col2-1]